MSTVLIRTTAANPAVISGDVLTSTVTVTGAFSDAAGVSQWQRRPFGSDASWTDIGSAGVVNVLAATPASVAYTTVDADLQHDVRLSVTNLVAAAADGDAEITAANVFGSKYAVNVGEGFVDTREYSNTSPNTGGTNIDPEGRYTWVKDFTRVFMHEYLKQYVREDAKLAIDATERKYAIGELFIMTTAGADIAASGIKAGDRVCAPLAGADTAFDVNSIYGILVDNVTIRSNKQKTLTFSSRGPSIVLYPELTQGGGNKIKSNFGTVAAQLIKQGIRVHERAIG